MFQPHVWLPVSSSLVQTKRRAGRHQPVLHQDVSELASHRPAGRGQDGRYAVFLLFLRVHCELPVSVKCHGCQACAVQIVFAVLVVTFLITYACCLWCLPGDLPKQVKVKKLSKLKTLDTKPGKPVGACLYLSSGRCLSCWRFVLAGIYTAYKTFLHKDKILIKRLLKVSTPEHTAHTGNAECRWLTVYLQGIQRKRPSEVQSAILRRHLLELTQSFIIPLVSSCAISSHCLYFMM